MKNKKVLLITPPYHSGVVESAGRWMPLSFVYLAGAIRSAGFEVEVYDAMTKQDTLKDIEQHLTLNKYDYVAITAITSSINAALEVIELTKQINPKTITILGGVHPTFCFQELLIKNQNIDFIVRNEGELTFVDLLLSLENKTNITSVKGISYKINNKIISNPDKAYIDDLDSLPMAWDLIDWKDYNYFVIPNSRLAAISTSRGCNHECTFCSQQKFWNKSWRARNPENVVKEIKFLKEVFNVNVFLIVDEYPTKDKNRWERFLDLLIQQELGIYLLMETRVEDIVRDKDILWKYKKAGIVHIYIGVEATNQKTLDLIKKDIQVEQSKQAIDLIHQHGMITETSFVLGFPWETKSTIAETLQLAKYYNPDFAHFLAITPWPYADIYEEMKEHIAIYDYSKYNLVEPVVKPVSMSLKEIETSIFECYMSYYMEKAPSYFSIKDNFKRNYILRSMKLIMKNSFLKKYFDKSNTKMNKHNFDIFHHTEI